MLEGRLRVSRAAERAGTNGDAAIEAVEEPTLFWRGMRYLCNAYFEPCYGFRAWGVENVPMTGPTLLVCNHQSFLDPIVVGLPLNKRRFHALARKTLWANPAMGWLITKLNAMPVDQENPGDLRAMRACLEVLNNRGMLLIFPEGARTLSGKTEDFQTGTMLLIRRAKPTVVPVAIDGAYEAWPRHGRPKPTGKLGIEFGRPIEAAELLAMKPEAALGHLRDTVERMRLNLARRMR